MAIRPPPSTRTYRSVEKNLDESHFDAEYYINEFCYTQEDYDVLWLATLAYRMYNPAWRKRSVFPSACDIIEMHLGYEPSDETPVWESYTDKRLSVIGLFAVQRLALFLEDEYTRNEDDLVVCEETVYCPVCNTESIDALLGYKFEYQGGMLHRSDEIGMINAAVNCKCKSFGVSDILAIEDSAIEAVFDDFNA